MTQEKLCQHIDAQLVFAKRDMAEAARTAACATPGTMRYQRALEGIQVSKRQVEEIRGRIEASGPKCNFCLERQKAGRAPARPALPDGRTQPM